MSKTKAQRVYNRCEAMIREQTQWTGKKPKVIRVKFGDYLLLVENSLTREDGTLAGHYDVTVRPADK